MEPTLHKVQWVNLDGWRLGIVEEAGTKKSRRYRVTTFQGAYMVEPSDLVCKPTGSDYTDRFLERLKWLGQDDGRRVDNWHAPKAKSTKSESRTIKVGTKEADDELTDD